MSTVEIRRILLGKETFILLFFCIAHAFKVRSRLLVVRATVWGVPLTRNTSRNPSRKVDNKGNNESPTRLHSLWGRWPSSQLLPKYVIERRLLSRTFPSGN
jgi:steroid 5-alpha reductase family enzyme